MVGGETADFWLYERVFLCLVLLLDMSEPERGKGERGGWRKETEKGAGGKERERERERKVVYFITLAQGAKSREAASAGVVSRCCWRYPAAATYKEL